VLFAPPGLAARAGRGLDGLARLLAAGRVPRFAIANPEHAPYGRAAEQALRRHGLWDALQPALVLGENVSQAAQFATTAMRWAASSPTRWPSRPPMRDRGHTR
jgi:molybdate transport system substrate-binding protein